MTLTRSNFLRRAPDSVKLSVPVREAKPAKGPRLKKCATCREPFEPRSPWARACSIECAQTLVDKESAAKERKADKARKLAIKPRSKWLQEAQAAFNAFIRARDASQPCICCGAVSHGVTGLNSHGWDCGHYRSTGSAPHLRFNEDNAHRQKVLCNRHGAGRAVDYRIGLIKRIGLARVDALESDQTPAKWTIADLAEIKANYKAKLRNLQVAT